MRKSAIVIIATAVVCGITAAALLFWDRQNQPDWSDNPYTFRSTTITARVGAYAPYAFLNKDGSLSGYVIDLSNAISRVMNVRITMLSKNLDRAQDYELQSDADVVLCMIKTPEATRYYDFTMPYAVHDFAVYVRAVTQVAVNYRNALANPGCVLNTDGVYFNLHKDSVSEIKCGLVDSAEEAMHLVSQGEYRFTIQESYIGTRVISERHLNNLVLLDYTGEKAEYCFGIKKGNPEIYRIFTEGLAHLVGTGQFATIQKHWLGERYLVTKSTRDNIITAVAVALGLILTFLLIAFVWSFALKRQVRERTAELEAEIAVRHQAENRLIQSQAQLIQADKMAAMGTLAAGVAHEINNPNGQVMLNVELLKRILQDMRPMLEARYQADGDFELGGIPWSRLQNKLDGLTGNAILASERIRAIVEDIKSFARVEGEDGTEAVDLNAVTGEALRLLQNMLKKKTGHLEVDYADDLPKISGRRQKIEQVALNIVLNACEALTDWEEAIRIRTGFEPETDSVFLSVSDEGVGIEPDQLKCILDPFYTSKREQGGTGLGLSISDTIIKAHNGSLEFTSEPGRGTTVVVRFPAGQE